MNIHKNARLTPRGREVLISRLTRGEHPQDVGAAMGVSASTGHQGPDLIPRRYGRSRRPRSNDLTPRPPERSFILTGARESRTAATA